MRPKRPIRRRTWTKWTQWTIWMLPRDGSLARDRISLCNATVYG
jgi:hypothetical protein